MEIAAITRSLRAQLAEGADLATMIDDEDLTGPMRLTVAQGPVTTWRVRLVAHDGRELFADDVDPAAFVANLEAFLGYAVRLARGTAAKSEARP